MSTYNCVTAMQSRPRGCVAVIGSGLLNKKCTLDYAGSIWEKLGSIAEECFERSIENIRKMLLNKEDLLQFRLPQFLIEVIVILISYLS